MSGFAHVTWRGAALAMLIAAAAVLALTPLLSANFHSDDLGWLAFVRHAESPWPAFVEPQIFGYFYRPSAFVHWWLAERLAGVSAHGHYFIAIALHASSGMLFALWLRRSGLALSIAAASAVVVTVAMPLAGTAMWLSSRNETLAIAAGLAALALAARGVRAIGPYGLFGVVLLLGVSCSAKETGLVFAVGVALQAVLTQWPERPWRNAVAWVALLPCLAVLAARQWVIVPIGPEAGGTVDIALLIDGVIAWWQHLPEALAGWGHPRNELDVALLGLVFALILGGFRAAWDGERRGILAVAIVLVLIPAPLQSPITSTVLPMPGADELLVNLRFYATATVGLVVLLALGLEVCTRTAMRRPAWAVLVLAAGASVAGSHDQAVQWSKETQAMAAPLSVARRLPADLAFGDTTVCVVVVEGSGLAAGLAPYLDAGVRILAPRGKLPRCLVVSDETPPYFAFFEAEACHADAAWAERGLVVANVEGHHHADLFGPLCQIALRKSPSGQGLRPDRRVVMPPPVR